MSVNDIYEDIWHIKMDIDQRIKHPYLMKFINVPIIDEQKLFLLYIILKQSNMSRSQIRDYILPTMLIQIALDTHEFVNNDGLDEDNPNTKSQQLTVLAGDYFSGLYYYLLATIDDIPMIKLLSNAVKVINEEKISVYQKDANELAELMDSVATVNSLLIQKVAEFTKRPDLKEVTKELLLIFKLDEEKQKYKENKYSVVIDGISSIIAKQKKPFQTDSTQILTVINSQVRNSFENIERILIKDPKLKELLEDKLTECCETMGLVKRKAVKEG
ncbi:heptaprenyl diphosphate synthase component 1 [Bacillus sp. Marseille-P3661]|uniref:heptaprenyl diphosphate synthase component 1 n=1 Tax=Bacillus sp. Marseille-P3661 TaxID=1936234 RepID=UPI002155CB6F|nr:heptaprenyl diphosphate synthase component 1 [Bacillus sp. Marseille-P3661]